MLSGGRMLHTMSHVVYAVEIFSAHFVVHVLTTGPDYFEWIFMEEQGTRSTVRKEQNRVQRLLQVFYR